MNTPSCLKDAEKLFTDQGIQVSNTWYHGTSSALIESILENGLIRSGDRTLRVADKKTMATIGGDYDESVDPVFLSPSSELAWYWAVKSTAIRNKRLSEDAKPVVLKVTLPEELNTRVRPDVGATSLLMMPEGKDYLAHVTALYKRVNIPFPGFDLARADRNDFLTRLGMAYLDQDIPGNCIERVECPDK